jgi:hypothetical protein
MRALVSFIFGWSAVIMTIKANSFTPEVLLSAPRRGAGAPNADGTAVLFTVSTYSFAEKKTTSELRLLDLKSNQSTQLLASSAEAKWLDEKTIIAFVSADKGTTDVVVGEASGDFNKT